MASALSSISSLYALVALISFLSVCSCSNLKQFNASNQFTTTATWNVHRKQTIATWYGAPNGFGSDGGSCGYLGAVRTRPFYKFVSAASPLMYKNGQGCGECYRVKCISHPACSGKPITVTITDSCPGCPGFDLSGTAFGAMAAYGKADALRGAGILKIIYNRTPCNYPGMRIAFTINPGSSPYFFATKIEYENEDGDLGKVEVQNGADPFLAMKQITGVTWQLTSPGGQLTGPLSLKLTTLKGKSITARKVIPGGWKGGRIYRSTVNFRKQLK